MPNATEHISSEWELKWYSLYIYLASFCSLPPHLVVSCHKAVEIKQTHINSHFSEKVKEKLEENISKY